MTKERFLIYLYCQAQYAGSKVKLYEEHIRMLKASHGDLLGIISVVEKFIEPEKVKEVKETIESVELSEKEEEIKNE